MAYSAGLSQESFKMNLGLLFLTVYTLGLITLSELDWITNHQSEFSRLDMALVIKIGRLMDSGEIEIDNKDLRIDTYRASGAGGQHVNKTDSAIRISHLPTGIVVQCQNQRSQHQNRASALKMLKSRLYEQELRKIEEKRSKNTQEKKEIGWGHQIRSYVLQPYKLVKDLRTGKESSDIDKVLDGDLDDFIFSIYFLIYNKCFYLNRPN